MKLRVAVWTIAASLVRQTAWAQAYKAPRAGDGHADLEGSWQARNTAYGSVEAHGASWGIRAGASVIVGPADGKIPYKPEMLAKREENFKNREKADPVNKCFLPGVPRVMYMPYPVQIFQTPTQIEIASEFAHTIRHVYVSSKGHYGEAEFWMPDSRAKWEGDTLVIDNGNFNAFQGNIENTLSSTFVTGGSNARSELYQMAPGSGNGTFLGYFELTPGGSLSFVAVPEPGMFGVGVAGGLDAIEHALHREVDIVHASEHRVVEAIEADCDALQTGLPEFTGLTRQQRAIGGQGKVAAGQLRPHFDQLLDVAPDQRLSAGQADLRHSARDEEIGEQRDLL